MIGTDAASNEPAPTHTHTAAAAMMRESKIREVQ